MGDSASIPILSVEHCDPAFAKELGYLGAVASISCYDDSRFSYSLHIPLNYFHLDRLRLVIPVHGSSRNAHHLREEFSSLAEKLGCAVLAPLFPTGVIDPNNTNNYKLISYRGIRYDEILLSMVDEVGTRYPRVETSQFLLYGFSGGGQFVHRFAYLHPERLQGLAIGAPGTITPLDYSARFPDGVKDLEAVFGVRLNWATLKLVPTLFIAGDADTDDFHARARGRSLEEIVPNGRFGGTVLLEASWRSEGANCHFVPVVGAKHEEAKMLPYVKDFFVQLLTKRKPIYNCVYTDE